MKPIGKTTTTSRKLQHVQVWRDPPTGEMRYYFRRRGHAKVNLCGDPATSTDALAIYLEALRGVEAKPRDPAGTVGALVTSFLAAHKVSPGHRRVLERFRGQCADGPVRTITAEWFEKHHAPMREQWGRANEWRGAMLKLFDYAVEHEMLPNNPARKLKRLRPKNNDGFMAWSREHVDAFRATWPIGTRERLALELLVRVGFRQSDAIRVGHESLRSVDGRLWWHFIEKKNEDNKPNRRNVPLDPELIEIMKQTPGHAGVAVWDTVGAPFLYNGAGTPFTRNVFNKFFRRACNAAGLPRKLGPHGLRKRCAINLVHAGCTEHQIQMFFSWRDIQMVAIYTRAADQEKMAAEAFERLVAAGRS